MENNVIGFEVGELEAAQEQLLNSKNTNTDDAAAKAAAEAARLASEEAAKNNNSSLTDADKIAAEEKIKTDAAAESARLAAEEAAKNPPPVKSFEETIAERTAGKFTKWEDLEKAINTPKEEFADDNIKHWNELAKKGIKLDKEFFDLQALDVDKMTDPEEIMLESMKRKPEGKNLDDDTLRTLLNKKYNIDEWIKKDDADLTPDDLANRKIMMRDAQNELEWLSNFKKERTFIPQQNPEQLAEQTRVANLRQENWEKFVDAELAAKVTNLSTTIDETTKEVFDYKISEADRKEIANTMKLLTKDVNVLFNQFAEKDDKGNLQINHRKVFEMLAKNKTYNEAVKNAFADGKAVGAKNFVKNDIKNINFKPGDNPVNTEIPKTEQEAIALALKNSGKSFH